MRGRKVSITPALQDAIWITRREQAGISQEAAASLAGISLSWWRAITKGTVETVPAATLARMCLAIGMEPGQLTMLGYPSVAEEMAKRETLGREQENNGQSPYHDAAERHLAATPEVEDGIQQALIVYLRMLRAAGRDSYAETVRQSLRH